MPTRVTGLKGYVAEAVIEYWLRRKYPPPTFQIVRQIIPTDVDRRGGGYLDFGVVEDGIVTEVYEVKGQDYIFTKDSEVNKALLHIWQCRGTRLEFITQDGQTFQADEAKGFLVLLAPPNADWIEKVGRGNIQFVKLFRDIWAEVDSRNDESEIVDGIMCDIAADIGEVMEILRNPTQGATKLQRFLELRDASE